MGTLLAPVARRAAEQSNDRGRGTAQPFEPDAFAVVEITARRALLRLDGQWSVPADSRPARPRLVALYGSRRLRVTPLPGSTDVRSADRWRAGFDLPRDVLEGRTAFALDLGRLGRVRLPAPRAVERRRAGAAARRRRILIVGHSPDERTLLRRFFESSAHEVTEVETGEAAVLELVCSDRVHAVLAADALADGPGLALVRWIRAGHADGARDVPVLVLGGDDSDDFKVRAYDAGADMVVAKPIDLDLLDRKLRAITRSAARTATAMR